jgi:hypothetical protein
MKHNLRLALVGAAIVAATAAAPARAQSIAGAFVGNMNYQLFDLTPDDGIDPAITFTGFTTSSASSYLFSDPFFTTVATSSTSSGSDLASAFASDASGIAIAVGSPFAVSASTTMTSNSGLSLSQSTLDFILSPNTRVIFTVSASVNAAPDFTEGGLGTGFASGLLYGQVGNNSSSGVTDFSSSVFTNFGVEDRNLSALVDSQGVESFGWIGMQAAAQSNSFATPMPAVPEPASAGMLAAGLGVLSGLVRARRRRPS